MKLVSLEGYRLRYNSDSKGVYQFISSIDSTPLNPHFHQITASIFLTSYKRSNTLISQCLNLRGVLNSTRSHLICLPCVSVANNGGLYFPSPFIQSAFPHVTLSFQYRKGFEAFKIIVPSSFRITPRNGAS